MTADRAQLLHAAAAALELRTRQHHRRLIGTLKAFVAAFWAIVEPKRPLVWGWHMDLICDELERSYRGEFLGPLVINIPPRHSKSSLVSVLAPAWWWLHHPETQFLAITKADKNAKRDARLMRRVVSSPLYRQLVARQLGDGHLSELWDWSPDQNELKYFANTAGGHRISITTNSDVTGAGADVLLLDDPHDAEEVAASTPERAQALMEEVAVKYSEVWCSRLNPGGKTQIIMQRLHERDLAGVVLAQPDTTALVLPLEFESEHPHRHPRDPRQEGEVLAPGRFGPRDLARMKATPQMFAGQAQQRPSPKGGGQIKRGWFRTFYKANPLDIAAVAEEVWVTSDAAKKAKATSDFHSIQVWARVGARKILLERICQRMDYPTYETTMDAVILMWTPTAVLLEDTANGTTYYQCRHAQVENLYLFHPNQTPGTDKSKAARAIYVERAAEAGQIELPDPTLAPWVPEWLHQIVSFPAVAHDDDMDAASQLFLWWALHPPTAPTPIPDLPEPVTREDPWMHSTTLDPDWQSVMPDFPGLR